MANAVASKYELKSLHEEISLFDRKLAHLLKYDVFKTEAERAAAAKKLNAKRELLVKSALAMTAEGIEYSASQLPRSMRGDEELPMEVLDEPQAPVEQVSVAELPSAASREQRRQGSAFAGTSLDWEKSLREYRSKKAKA